MINMARQELRVQLEEAQPIRYFFFSMSFGSTIYMKR